MKKGKSKGAKPRAAARRRLLTFGTITIPIGSGGTTSVEDPLTPGQFNVHVVANLVPDTDEFVFTTDLQDRDPQAVAKRGTQVSQEVTLTRTGTTNTWTGDIDGVPFEPLSVLVTARFVGAPQEKEQPFAIIAPKPRGKGQRQARAATRTAKKAVKAKARGKRRG